ncbi:MAG: recombinase RecQ [Gammaproteobacteria bacterium]|nr:MAG: recombinase RecQ [Gammaproteobacteria bacterium]
MVVNSAQLLQQIFGFECFNTGQQQVVDTVLAGRSAAAIFPTGSGKSLCYQLPATQLPHLTLVVSPLLALMQDQLAFLASKHISAASIDSMQTREQSTAVMNGVRSGEIKILMISVERLNNERFRQFLAQVRISLLVVDEAHCISEWGHNFRPDYLKLPQYQRDFNIPQTLLLTATATTKVVADMGAKFAINQEDITLTGFYRENLHLAVQGVNSSEKITVLGAWLQDKVQQAGIVYVTLQQTAEQVAQQLQQYGFNAQAYHAGMKSDQRQHIQQQFMNSHINIIVATIAFGMGIDKSDIRYVVHYDLPKSIENYAQEIGRAGRDGQVSQCLVLANQDNLNVLENFVYGDTPELSAIRYVLTQIAEQTEQVSSQKMNQWEVLLNSLSSDSNIRLLSLKTLLVYLELLQVIKPAYSYFAEYKYKFLQSQTQVLAHFDENRQAFLKAIFNSSDTAKIWSTVNFERLQQTHPNERERALKALDYLHEKNCIELQSTQMTQVYQVNLINLNSAMDIDKLSDKLYQRFSGKETSEITRIQQLLAFFTSSQCLSKQLAEYFSDHQLSQGCGNCSVCRGNIAQLPPQAQLAPLSSYNFADLSMKINEKLAEKSSATLISRFFCGLTTPIFTKLRVRKFKGFAVLENYRFSEVKAWVEENNE